MGLRRAAAAVLLLGGAVGGGGCANDGGTLVVYAAASLSDTFTQLAQTYEEANPDVDVRLSFAGSNRLASQIDAGAAADVFAAADETNMDRVLQTGRTSGAPVVFARNRLALAVPAGNPGRVTGLADLADGGLVVAVCAPEVPCGALAQAVLGYAGIDAAPDTLEPSVRAVLTKLELGEADVGLVYVSDVAAAAGRVEAVPIDDGGLSTAYPVVALSEDPHAVGFVSLLTGAEGRSVLAEHGFGAP